MHCSSVPSGIETQTGKGLETCLCTYLCRNICTYEGKGVLGTYILFCSLKVEANPLCCVETIAMYVHTYIVGRLVYSSKFYVLNGLTYLGPML
jgi:hypothetical protein